MPCFCKKRDDHFVLIGLYLRLEFHRIMIIMRYIIALCLGFISLTSVWSQGPLSGFLTGRGKTDLAINYASDSYDDYFFGDEKRAASTQTQFVSLYLEHGFTDTLSLVATLPYMWTDPENPSLQDATIFLKYRNQYQEFQEGALSFVTGVGLSFPVGNYQLDVERPIGNRSTVFQGRIISQYNFFNGLFFHLQGGVDFRVTPDSQIAIPLLFRTGWGTSKIYGEAWVEWRNTFDAVADTQVGGGSGSDWLRVGATLYYPIVQNIGVTAAIAQFINGRNIGLSTMYSFGVVYRHDWRK